ncbi:MAG: DUF4373 domain-containing protein [Ruminococcus sp.]|nr:DUF4373 domain-containing protein [Ruminococcus sp.]
MARPQKNGLDYFPFDTDFFSDKKIKRLRARYGNDGVMVYIYILCEIYREGYYIEYDEDLILDISDELNISENATKQIVSYLLSRSLLDSTLAKSVNVLTASSIQRRYQKAVEERGKHRDIIVDGKFWVLKENETESFIKVRPVDGFSRNNNSFSLKNSDKSDNNYTKESKVKKSKLKESKAYVTGKPSEAPFSDECILIFELYNRICTSYPRVTAFSENRKKAVRARLKTYSVQDFEKLFKKAQSSDFLKGRNNRNWSANFDWLVKDANIAKVLDGNYDNHESSHEKEYSFDLDDYKSLVNNFKDDENE